MKTTCSSRSGFTLVENLTATAVVSLVALGLIGMAIMAGKLVKSARETVNAAEIAEAKLEALRSCTWSQLTDSRFVPRRFAVTNGPGYDGTIVCRTPSISEDYRDELVEVSVRLAWTSDDRPRSLEMTTYISRYGFASHR